MVPIPTGTVSHAIIAADGTTSENLANVLADAIGFDEEHGLAKPTRSWEACPMRTQLPDSSAREAANLPRRAGADGQTEGDGLPAQEDRI